MKIDILTLFPNMFDGFLTESIIKRAINKKLVEINIKNIRDYSTDKHKKVDDTPYGGGAGMVLKCQPIFDAVEDLQKGEAKVILMTPQGITLNQKIANRLSEEKHLIVISGHYEGFDERIRTICDMELSIGDYVLTGGELPSMVLTDAIVRLVDGVIEKESVENDSFQKDLLDYPQYTKPKKYKDLEVPEVLLSGDHKKIEEYRKEEKVKKTKEKRPDLIKEDSNEKITEKKAVQTQEKTSKKKTTIKPAKKEEAKVAKKTVSKVKEKEKTPVKKAEPKKEVTKKEEPKKKTVKKEKKVVSEENPKKGSIESRVEEVEDSVLIKRIAVENIERRMQYILKMLLEENDEDTEIKVLDEVERIKQILFLEYNNLLEEEYKEDILEKLYFIVENIRILQVEIEKEEIHKSK